METRNLELSKLRQAFEGISAKVELKFNQSEHEDQKSMKEILSVFNASHKLISSSPTNLVHDYPHFGIFNNGTLSGVSFSVVPDSGLKYVLISAILSCDRGIEDVGSHLIDKVRQIEGECIQTIVDRHDNSNGDFLKRINNFAILNNNFDHEIIDKEYAIETIKELNIKSFPAVVFKDKVINFQDISYKGIIQAFENEFGLRKKREENE